ncbi:MAG: GumC family protein [Fervidobacterium sp.]
MMTPEINNNELTFHDIVYILKKRFFVGFSIFIIILLATVIYLFFIAKPEYEVSALVKVTGSSTPQLSGTAALILGTSGVQSFDDQLIIKSRPVILGVIKELNLVDYYKSKAKSDKEKEKISENSVFEMLAEKIQVTNEKNTSLIRIRLTDPDKEIAHKILKSLIDNYTKISAQLNKDEKSYTKEMLEKQLPILQAKIKELEDKIRKFRLEKSYSPSIQAEENVKRYMELQNQLTNIMDQIELIQKNVDLVLARIKDMKGQIVDLSYIPQSPVISQLRSKLIDLNIQKSVLLEKYTEESEEVRAINAQIKQTQKSLQDEINKILSSKFDTTDPVLSGLYSELFSLQTEYKLKEFEQSSIKKRLETLENELKKLPAYEQEYINLQEEYQTEQSIYSQLLLQYEQAKLSEAGLTAKIPVVVEEPYIPEKPTKPNKKLTLAIGSVLGIFLGILGIFVRETTDPKIRDEQEITKIFGKIPIIYSENDLENSIKSIAIALFESQPKTIGFSRVGEFRTDIPQNFTKSLYQSTQITILTAAEKRYSSSDSVNIIVEPEMHNLPVGRKYKELSEKIDQLKQQSELLILDLPKSTAPAFLVLSQLADKVALIVRKNLSGKSELYQTLASLNKKESNVIIIFEK